MLYCFDSRPASGLQLPQITLPAEECSACKVEGIGVEDGQVGVLAGCDGAGVLTDTETLCRRTGKHAQDAAPVTVGSRESPHAK
jgi:hypothetical protein